MAQVAQTTKAHASRQEGVMSCLAPNAEFIEERQGVRLYRAEGVLLPSASSIVAGVLPKEGLRRWAQREAIDHMTAILHRYVGRVLTPEALALAREEALRRPDALARQAAAIGQDAHAALAQLVTEGGEPTPIELEPVVRWLQSWEQAGFSWHGELALGSPAVGAAGRLDLLGVRVETNEAVVADLKTSDAVRNEHFLQLGIYANIACHLGLEVCGGFILLLPRTGTGLEVMAVDLPRWQRAATYATELFWSLKEELLLGGADGG
jgi:hypothetical protein